MKAKKVKAIPKAKSDGISPGLVFTTARHRASLNQPLWRFQQNGCLPGISTERPHSA